MNLYKHIATILKKNEKYSSNGDLLKNIVVEDALKLAPELLSLLISDARAKKYFFSKVHNTIVFDKILFQKFISNKQFLPDSYTVFKNKIGLTTHEKFFTEAEETVLSWPYKDCVLEGGQTKENQKRKEIFWNETLAPDEIDRLFEPKVLTNFKRFDKDGKHLVKSISVDDNLILKGNNLLALHSLNKVYKGKIKLIYIDPPYNTGNDSFQYNDSFRHATWLTFMKNRLEIAWQLLKNDGAFFIQVDDNEFAYLKILCDEIFGRQNFRETIVLKSSTESGVNAINVKRGERLFKVKEYILFYSKNTSFRFKPFYTKADFNINYKYEVVKSKGKYTVTNLSKRFRNEFESLKISSKEKDLLAKNKFIQYALKNAKHIYSLEKNIKKSGYKFKKFAALNKKRGGVDEYINAKNELKLIYEGGVFVPLNERLVKTSKGNSFGVLASDLWVDIGTTPSNEGGVKFSNGKKSEKLLKRIIEMTTDEGDVVLDYHLGSGTTAAVAHKMKRQYIGLEQMDYGENDSTVRLQKVINGEQSGVSKILKWQGGGSFVYAELAKNNAIFIESIEKAKNVNQLLEIYNQLKDNHNINFKVCFDAIETNVNDYILLSFEEQQKILIDLLDKNNLYINYADINDADYILSKEVILLNNKFYR